MHARQAFTRYLLAAAMVAPFATVAGQAPAYKWGPAPAVFPAGAKMAVLHGDPGKAEYFTVRLEFPNGYRIAPHWHPTDEAITVISGTFLVGMGDAFDAPRMMTLPAGGFVVAGATMHHYAEARGKTVVQVSAMGPFAMTYVNAADDPTKKAGRKK
jgi:quercetin dioxygenase-like cupin family protein